MSAASVLNKNRDQRWATMHDLGSALAAWLSANGETDDIAGNSLKGRLNWRPAEGDPLSSVSPPDGPDAPAATKNDAPDFEAPSKQGSSRALWVAAGLVACVALGAAVAVWLKTAGSQGDGTPAAASPTASPAHFEPLE